MSLPAFLAISTEVTSWLLAFTHVTCIPLSWRSHLSALSKVFLKKKERKKAKIVSWMFYREARVLGSMGNG